MSRPVNVALASEGAVAMADSQFFGESYKWSAPVADADIFACSTLAGLGAVGYCVGVSVATADAGLRLTRARRDRICALFLRNWQFCAYFLAKTHLSRKRAIFTPWGPKSHPKSNLFSDKVRCPPPSRK